MTLKKNLREFADGKTPQLDLEEQPEAGWADGDGLTTQEREAVRRDMLETAKSLVKHAENIRPNGIRIHPRHETYTVQAHERHYPRSEEVQALFEERELQ